MPKTIDPRAIELVERALKTPSVQQLHDEIMKGASIKLEYKQEGAWGNVLSNGTTDTIITVAPTAYPNSALAHELLHCQLKLAGYRQRTVMVSMEHKQKILISILEALDNEVQHHRMFPVFLEMGLPPEQFYHDGDTLSFKKVRQELKDLSPDSTTEEFLLSFLTIIAPGGVGNDKSRVQLKNLLKTRCSQTTWGTLEKIETVIHEWANASTLDVGDYLARIIRLISGYDRTWIGTSNNFPDSGIFIAQPFTVEEVLEWHAQNP